MHVNTPGIDRVPVPTRLELIHCLVHLHRERTIEHDRTCPYIDYEASLFHLIAHKNIDTVLPASINELIFWTSPINERRYNM